MFRLRCTGRLQKVVGKPQEPSADPTTTRLGDWYANIVCYRPRIILCVSEKTLFPVLLRGKDARKNLTSDLRDQLAMLLRQIGVNEDLVEEELQHMQDVQIAKTASRTVLGTMNDFSRMLPYHLDTGDSLTEAALQLAEAPCSPIKMEQPWRATLDALGQPKPKSPWIYAKASSRLK